MKKIILLSVIALIGIYSYKKSKTTTSYACMCAWVDGTGRDTGTTYNYHGITEDSARMFYTANGIRLAGMPGVTATAGCLFR